GFGGTGMTGVAADECKNENAENKIKFSANKFKVFGKRHAICSDLSPVATFISYNLNSESSNESIISFNEALEDTYKKFGSYFKTKHHNNKDGEINYVIWSDVIACSGCNNEETFWDLFIELGSGVVK